MDPLIGKIAACPARMARRAIDVAGRRWTSWLALGAALASGAARAQRVESLGPAVRAYVQIATPRVILEHVELIDGTGAAPRPDQNIHLEGGKITAITPGEDVAPRDGTTVLDLRGHA